MRKDSRSLASGTKDISLKGLSRGQMGCTIVEMFTLEL